MITLRKLAVLHISDVSGGDQSRDSQLDDREVMLKIRQYMSEVLALAYYGKLSEGDRSSITQYIASYDLSISNGTPYKYLTLPEFYVALPFNKGVHRVFEKDKPKNDFIMIHNPAVTQNLISNKLKGKSYFYVQGLNIYFSKLSNSAITTATVQLIIPAPDTIGPDDPLPIIPEQQSQILRLLKEDYFGIQKDYVNDNNNNVGRE